MEGTELNNYLIFMHLSQLGSLVVPMVGFVIPLVMWLVRKDENDLIDLQGREIINWLIFELIAVVVCLVLSFVIIGIPMLIVLGVLGIVFPIIGAVKASKGEFYRYPMMFRVIG
ncbi:MAG: hypothetical protein CMJ34_00935 [Phycisphaerae bacterium]|nr:hypothetical protein [Phycisphaerae bacterium]